MSKLETKEKQYSVCLEEEQVKLGLMSNFTWKNDPKRLLFVMSRYKFVAKMFADYENVLEIGCADAFASRIVAQSVNNLTVSDFDPLFIKDVNERNIDSNFEVCEYDILKGGFDKKFNGIFALDVLEHIEPNTEDSFMENLLDSLEKNGSAIIGIPSINSQKFASEESKKGHVNCKSHKQLKSLCQEYFHNVFIFSMNDEVVHTGFDQMANYFLTICCNPKK